MTAAADPAMTAAADPAMTAAINPAMTAAANPAMTAAADPTMTAAANPVMTAAASPAMTAAANSAMTAVANSAMTAAANPAMTAAAKLRINGLYFALRAKPKNKLPIVNRAYPVHACGERALLAGTKTRTIAKRQRTTQHRRRPSFLRGSLREMKTGNEDRYR